MKYWVLLVAFSFVVPAVSSDDDSVEFNNFINGLEKDTPARGIGKNFLTGEMVDCLVRVKPTYSNKDDQFDLVIESSSLKHPISVRITDDFRSTAKVSQNERQKQLSLFRMESECCEATWVDNIYLEATYADGQWGLESATVVEKENSGADIEELIKSTDFRCELEYPLLHEENK